MSEDAPQDPNLLPPQENQGEPQLALGVEQQQQVPGQRIEVVSPDEQSQVTPTETSEVPEQSFDDTGNEPTHLGSIDHSSDESGLIVDPEKARDMAEAGKYERTEAAGDRLTVKTLKELLAETETVAAMPSETQEQKEAKDERTRELEIGMENLSRESQRMFYKVLTGKGDEKADDYPAHTNKSWLEGKINNLEEKAAEKDKAAEPYEEWAAILHDHPVSAEYRKAHPGVEFGLRSLILIDAEYKQKLEDIEWLEKMIEEAGPLTGVDGLAAGAGAFNSEWLGYGFLKGFDPNHVVSTVYGDDDDQQKDITPEMQELKGAYRQEGVGTEEYEKDRQKREEWRALRSSPDTTLGQIRDFYLEALKVGLVGPIKSSAAAFNNILEDIRSGRASQ